MSAFQENFFEHDSELEDYEENEVLGNDSELDLELDELDVMPQELEAEEEIRQRSRVPLRLPRTRPLSPRPPRPRPQPAARRPPAYRPKPRRVIRRHPRSVFAHEPVTCICPEKTCPQHGTEYIRWVQSVLNDVLGLRLRVNGIMGRETRSAVRSFQERQGLPVTGIVGPDIESALIAARGGKSPKTEAAKPAVPGMPEPAEPAATPPGPDSAESAAEFDFEWEEEANRSRKTPFRYVNDFSGPASECAAALKRAGKTRAEALTIINAQIGVAVAMLRKAATNLKRGSRSSGTKALFLKVFRVKPEFVPSWLKPTATIKDRGDVAAIRCKRVADLLASGTLKFFCRINSTNCPDCPDDPSDFACSSWGDESKAPRNSNVVCLGNAFWDDMKAGKTNSLLATLTHEPFHIYYGKYVTAHVTVRGKFGGINCIMRFVFETNGRTAPDRVNERCWGMPVRKEIDEFLS